MRRMVGELKQAQVSTARQTPQQITDQYLASQKSLTQRKATLSQALERESALKHQNTNASNVYNITCVTASGSDSHRDAGQ